MTGLNEDRHGFLARIRSGEGVVQREFDGQEYETKFAMERAHNDETIEYLRDIEKCFHDDDRYLLDTVHDESRYTSHFFESPEGEYSVFEYGGGPMLKIKGHQIDAGDTLPVFLNTERFITDSLGIRRIIDGDSVSYVGSMIKSRAKDFVVDSLDGRVYSMAVTLCECNGVIQRQCEVEYSGCISNYEYFQMASTDAIVARLRELSLHVQVNSPIYLIPDVERKLEFVQANSDPTSFSTSKSAILDDLLGQQRGARSK